MSTNHVKIMNKPTRISGILIDYVSIEKTLMEKFSLIITVEHIYFSDHDVLRIVIEKKTVVFKFVAVQSSLPYKCLIISFHGFNFCQ